jgi:hypothetical protein
VTPPSAPNASCARSGGPFRCGIDDPGPCVCTTLQVPPALLAQLEQRYTGCLCLPCLQTLAAAAGQNALP